MKVAACLCTVATLFSVQTSNLYAASPDPIPIVNDSSYGWVVPCNTVNDMTDLLIQQKWQPVSLYQLIASNEDLPKDHNCLITARPPKDTQKST